VIEDHGFEVSEEEINGDEGGDKKRVDTMEETHAA